MVQYAHCSYLLNKQISKEKQSIDKSKQAIQFIFWMHHKKSPDLIKFILVRKNTGSGKKSGSAILNH